MAKRQIGAFVDYHNNQRYHESLNNVTPADFYFGRDKAILREREKIKKQTTPLATSKTSRIINHTDETEPPMLKPL